MEAALDAYTAREDRGVAAVRAYADDLHHRACLIDLPGREEDGSVGIALLLSLARPISNDEWTAIARVGLHIAVMSLWCPRPAEHHFHHDEPTVFAPDVALLIAQDVHAGHRSIRGLTNRYAHLGTTRDTVRHVLWNLAPDYMTSHARHHGPSRETVRDHAANRQRRRRDRRYAATVDDAKLRRLWWVSGRVNQWAASPWG